MSFFRLDPGFGVLFGFRFNTYQKGVASKRRQTHFTCALMFGETPHIGSRKSIGNSEPRADEPTPCFVLAPFIQVFA